MAETQALKDLLQARFVGKSLHDVGTPAVVLDLAKIEANCNLMLEAVEKLGLGWRAHIKTHKTTELTRLQVGNKGTSPVNIIVSTVLEAENIVPLLKEYRDAGRKVNVLYAFPLLGSYVDRLSRIASQLGPGSLSILVDHADQLPHISALAAKSGDGNRPQVFLKVDMGYHRAGIPPDTPECTHLINELLRAEAAGSCDFLGLYCHAGHSYSTRREWEALGLLGQEIAVLQGVAQTVKEARRSLPSSSSVAERPLVLSVGATPTTTSIQHPGFFSDEENDDGDEAAAATPGVPGTLKAVMRDLKADGFTLEMHAGVSPCS
ncbi:putative alanine racemase domain protein [Eutypa lata UCREL1]|uniref:Putative alanine racemase domain protein n=1 Tax=Eutypa lata (strain UCR-EL1) TaxID=1287681 RepID=M7SEC3_EUTLA|nr:putative alanine racemase domain protein [Eutypa lata UCREL1]